LSIQVFAHLIDKLYFTSSNLAKSALIREYLSATPDPDRGWAIAAIAGTLNFDFFKRKLIKDLIVERVDPLLFELSYDYVGEMSSSTKPCIPYFPFEQHERFRALGLTKIRDTRFTHWCVGSLSKKSTGRIWQKT